MTAGLRDVNQETTTTQKHNQNVLLVFRYLAKRSHSNAVTEGKYKQHWKHLSFQELTLIGTAQHKTSSAKKTANCHVTADSSSTTTSSLTPACRTDHHTPNFSCIEIYINNQYGWHYSPHDVPTQPPLDTHSNHDHSTTLQR